MKPRPLVERPGSAEVLRLRARARSRAITRLIEANRDEYERYYADERAKLALTDIKRRKRST